MSPEEIVKLIDFRYITDCITPRRSAGAPARARRGRQGRAHRRPRSDGYPCYTTSAGWLGYPDDKLRRLCQEASTPASRTSR
jgi:L-fuconate dehydratase